MNNLLSWILCHGIDNAELYPPLREARHLEAYDGMIVAVEEEDWAIVQEYITEEAAAITECRQRIQRAGEVYLWKLARLKLCKTKPVVENKRSEWLF